MTKDTPGGIVRTATFMTMGVLVCMLLLHGDPAIAAEQETTSDDVMRETRDAVETAKQYTIEKKDRFGKAAWAELNDLQTRIKELQTKMTTLSGETRTELEKAIKDLEAKKKDARKKLKDMDSATASTWNKVKEEMNTALKDLKKAYKEAISQLP
jgi:TolA-binding protein